MLAKFSVKKPYTIAVAIVLIIILGFVSYSHMTLDLLPSINLPYAVISTSYVGASPEQVEQTVTKPCLLYTSKAALLPLSQEDLGRCRCA